MQHLKMIGLLLFLLSLIKISAQESTIELKDNFFYIDGEKYFIKGIGYEVGAYPGMLPWARPFNQDILESDLNRITDAGFNTIRTWGAFTNQELQVVQTSGLKIIMGIWIDPEGDYSDPAFVSASLQTVEDVLAYSKNYDNIIGYLIMNEPMPEHIFDIGYSHVYTLWKRVIQLIHTLHPQRPVTIANTCVGDFIDPQIFDFSAYNIYPYNPATVNYSHKYPAYVNTIFSQRTDGHPLIITEYGLSVSPSGPGSWGYGGNTLEEQKAGIQYMYRSLIDGHASGSCIFIYSDGWWKAGNEFTHDDAAEEWFGLVEYTSVDDVYGVPRIVWDSVAVYNRAIISSPKNQGIYTSQIPVEIFSQDEINRFEIRIDNATVMDESISGNYFSGTLNLASGSIGDYNLTFYFFNSSDQLLKTESVSLLASDDPVQLPDLNITVSPEPEPGDHTIEVTYEIANSGPLQTDYVLDYVFYNHIGWDYGTAASEYLSEVSPTYTTNFSYSSAVDVITLAAGIDATYGSFTKRITAGHIYLLGDTAHTDPPVGHSNEMIQKEEISIYPNPASDRILIKTDYSGESFCRIMDISGRILLESKFLEQYEADIHTLPKGCYLVSVWGNPADNLFTAIIKTE